MPTPARQVVFPDPGVLPGASALPALRPSLRLHSAGPAGCPGVGSLCKQDRHLVRAWPFPRSTVRTAAVPRELVMTGHVTRACWADGGAGGSRRGWGAQEVQPGPLSREASRREGWSRGGGPGRIGAGDEQRTSLPWVFPEHVQMEARRGWRSVAKLLGRWESTGSREAAAAAGGLLGAERICLCTGSRRPPCPVFSLCSFFFTLPRACL